MAFTKPFLSSVDKNFPNTRSKRYAPFIDFRRSLIQIPLCYVIYEQLLRGHFNTWAEVYQALLLFSSVLIIFKPDNERLR